jgi:hypothetical protein
MHRNLLKTHVMLEKNVKWVKQLDKSLEHDSNLLETVQSLEELKREQNKYV